MYKYAIDFLKLKETKLVEILKKVKTVEAVSKELGVSRQSVHKWLIRYKRFGIDGLVRRKKKYGGVPHNKTPPDVEVKVVSISQKYWQDGVEILHDRLLYEEHLEVHPTTIFRILKRKKIRYIEGYIDTQRRWKKRLYAHEKEGVEIQMDTTYPYGYGSQKVIYTAIDDATRIAYAYTYPKASSENTVDFLKRLRERTSFNIQKIRTDQGKEFIAKIVKKYLQDVQIVHRANTPYSPEENGKIERFHRTLNEKCIRFGLLPDDSLDTFNYKLTLFLHYYNHIKKHRGLGMNGMSPFEKLHVLKSERV
jgi:transposase InsO family protein